MMCYTVFAEQREPSTHSRIAMKELLFIILYNGTEKAHWLSSSKDLRELW